MRLAKNPCDRLIGWRVAARSKRADREFQDALEKLMIMELMQKNNLVELARALSRKQKRDISLEEMKGLIRKHFQAAVRAASMV